MDRALDLLQTLAADGGEMSLSTLAARTGLHLTTAHRLLRTLVRRGLARQDPGTGRYFAAVRLTPISELEARAATLRIAARPILRRLATATGEDIELCLREGHAAVRLDAVAGRPGARPARAAGTRAPLHATAAGKVLLAQLLAPRRDALIGTLAMHRHTPRTLTTPDELRAELDRVRTEAHAVEDEELEAGIRSIAVPVGAFAALALSGPLERLARPRLAGLVTTLRRGADRLARAAAADDRRVSAP